VPEGAEVLDVQLQNGEPAIWFMCDTEKPKVSMHLVIHGTGRPIEELGFPQQYIGTVQQRG
jgi:hypothetical protein